MKQKRNLCWMSCRTLDEIPHTNAFANYLNNKAYKTLSNEMYDKVYALCNIINKGYDRLSLEDTESLNEMFPGCNIKDGIKTNKAVSRILAIIRFEIDEDFIKLFSKYVDEINPIKIVTEPIMPTPVKELTVTITDGNLHDGEYMVRRMTPEQIYETLRDGFTVKANSQS